MCDLNLMIGVIFTTRDVINNIHGNAKAHTFQCFFNSINS